MTRKLFFTEPSAAEIKKRQVEEISPQELDEALETLDGKFLLVRGSIVPDEFDSHRKFLKHGREIITSRPDTMHKAMEKRQFPYQAKRESVEKMLPDISYAGWSFRPFSNDRRKRRILFTADFEAAQLYAYAHQSGARIKVKPYADARRVKTEGAEIFAEVPSRTEGHQRYKFKFMAAPVIDSAEKFYIAHNLGTTHSCPDVDFRIRYRYENDVESSQVLNLDAHVGAAWLGVIDYYWSEEKNKVPLNAGQFDIPTIKALEFYKRLAGQTLIQEEENGRLRKLDKAERNIAIANRLRRVGYDEIFFPAKSISNQVNIRDYDWSFS